MNDKSKLEERISSLEHRVFVLEEKLKNPNDIRPAVSREKTLSEQEYLREKKPNSAVEKTLFLGNYLEKYKGMNSFTVEDLRRAFRAARESIPSNISDNINKNIKKGFLMEDSPKGTKKAWMLTTTGEKRIKGKVEGDFK